MPYSIPLGTGGYSTLYDPSKGLNMNRLNLGTGKIENEAPAAPAAPSLSDQLKSRLFNQTNTPVFNQGAFNQGLMRSAGNQRRAVNSIYSNEAPAQINDLNRALAPQRSNLVNELAARGVQGSPVASYSLDRFETGRNQGISDIIRNLGTERAKSQVGVETGLQGQLQQGSQMAADLGLRQANMQQSGNLDLLRILQGGDQFSQDLLEKIRQYNDSSSRLDQQSRDALTLGKMQADAAEPSDWEKAAGIMQGVGSLAGGAAALGGTGGLSGLVGMFGKKKTQ